jgi:hypothetical protein
MMSTKLGLDIRILRFSLVEFHRLRTEFATPVEIGIVGIKSGPFQVLLLPCIQGECGLELADIVKRGVLGAHPLLYKRDKVASRDLDPLAYRGKVVDVLKKRDQLRITP